MKSFGQTTDILCKNTQFRRAILSVENATAQFLEFEAVRGFKNSNGSVCFRDIVV